MKRTGTILVVLASLAFAGTALAQPRVTVGEIKGKGGVMIRGAAVKALQAERSVSLISKDVIAGSARRMGLELPKARKELSAALGIGAWIEGTIEREKKTLVTNLAVIDAASGKTLGVMSYDAPNIRALAKAVRGELFSDLGELIKSAKAPGKKGAAAAEDKAVAQGESAEDEAQPTAASGKKGARGKPVEAPVAAAEPADEPADDALTAASDTADQAEASEPVAQTEAPASEPASDNNGPLPSPFVLGVGLAGFTRDFVYNEDISHLPQYDLGLGPSLAVNVNWYPAAHFSNGAAANIGLDLRGQLAFGLDSEVANNSSFPTSSSAFGVGVRGRIPLGSTELGAVVGYGQKSFTIGTLDKTPADPSKARPHPYVPSTSYSFLRIGADARFALSDKFSLGLGLAFLPTFKTGVEAWFPRATASGIEGEAKVGYAMTSSVELTAAFGLQRFGLAFNSVPADVALHRPVAGGAVDQYLSLTLGVGWHFAP